MTFTPKWNTPRTVARLRRRRARVVAEIAEIDRMLARLNASVAASPMYMPTTETWASQSRNRLGA